MPKRERKVEEGRMDKQLAPERDLEREKLEDELKAEVEKVELAQDEGKTEEEKIVDEWIDEAVEPEETGEKEVEEVLEEEKVGETEEKPEPKYEERDVEEKSAKQQQAEEMAEKRRFDICPYCGQHSIEGAIQPKIPLPIGDQAILIALPLLVCIRCTNAYMPRSFVKQIIQPETEKPKIITP